MIEYNYIFTIIVSFQLWFPVSEAFLDHWEKTLHKCIINIIIIIIIVVAIIIIIIIIIIRFLYFLRVAFLKGS